MIQEAPHHVSVGQTWRIRPGSTCGLDRPLSGHRIEILHIGGTTSGGYYQIEGARRIAGEVVRTVEDQAKGGAAVRT
jgi:hypothetical protein